MDKCTVNPTDQHREVDRRVGRPLIGVSAHGKEGRRVGVMENSEYGEGEVMQ